MPSRANAVTRDAAGRLWTLLGTRGGGAGAVLRVLVSEDCGASWSPALRLDAPDGRAIEGSIAASPAGGPVACSWYVQSAPGVNSVWFREFDPDARRWLGPAARLFSGRSKADSYAACDLDVGEDGAIALTLVTGEAPKQGRKWRGGWNAGLLVRPAEKDNWLQVEQVNVRRSGGIPQVVVLDDVAYVAFTAFHLGARAVFLRAFDFVGGRWLDEKGVVVAPTVEGRRMDAFSFAADGEGRLYCMFGVAAFGPGKPGRLVVASTAPDRLGRWDIASLRNDEIPVSHDLSRWHFSLAAGPGALMVARYTLFAEQHRRLYERALHVGRAVGAERLLLDFGRASRWVCVNGLNSGRRDGPPVAIVSGQHRDVAAVGWLRDRN